MSKIKFFIVDVFAERKYEGNQLAVFLDLENQLTSEAMQAIAKEINFAESSFIKSNSGNRNFGVRIFTPELEVPFAGHPSLGTSYVISKFLLPQPRKELVLELAIGDIAISILNPENIDDSVLFMTQTQPQFFQTFTPNEIYNELRIPIDFFDHSMPIQEITTGLPYIIIPLKNLTAMENIRLESLSVRKFLEKRKRYKTNSDTGQTTSLFFFTKEVYEKGSTFNTRMLMIENEKLGEDAATGSANGCFLAYLLKYVDKKIAATVEQGFQMGRKSRLYLNGAMVENTFQLNVGGRAKLVSEGTWFA